MTAPTTRAITHFYEKHAKYWELRFAIDVIRETRRASRNLAHFMYLTGLEYPDAAVLWVSGKDARQELAA